MSSCISRYYTVDHVVLNLLSPHTVPEQRSLETAAVSGQIPGFALGSINQCLKAFVLFSPQSQTVGPTCSLV